MPILSLRTTAFLLLPVAARLLDASASRQPLGFGDTKSTNPNPTAAGRAQNRRVEVDKR